MIAKLILDLDVADPMSGFVTKCAERSFGKDTSTGHWEIALAGYLNYRLGDHL